MVELAMGIMLGLCGVGAGIALIVLLILAALTLYLYRYKREFLKPRMLSLLGLIFVLVTISSHSSK